MLKCNKFYSHFCHVSSETIMVIGFWHIFCSILFFVTEKNNRNYPFIQNVISISFGNISMMEESLFYLNLFFFLSMLFMIYGAFACETSFLIPFLFLQVSDFNLTLITLIDNCFHFDISDIFHPQPRIFVVQLQELGIENLLIPILLIFIALLLIKGYFICVLCIFMHRIMDNSILLRVKAIMRKVK